MFISFTVLYYLVMWITIVIYQRNRVYIWNFRYQWSKILSHCQLILLYTCIYSALQNLERIKINITYNIKRILQKEMFWLCVKLNCVNLKMFSDLLYQHCLYLPNRSVYVIITIVFICWFLMTEITAICR